MTIDRLESTRHQSARPPTKPAYHNRDQFEHAHASNPYSTTYNSNYSDPNNVQSKPPPTQPKQYNSSNYDEFDPIRPSSRSKASATPAVVSETQQQRSHDEFERANMKRASARYRQKWKQPAKATDNEPVLFTSSSSEQIDQHHNHPVDYAPTTIIHNPAATPGSGTSSSAAAAPDNLIDFSGNKPADSTGMHNIKKGFYN